MKIITYSGLQLEFGTLFAVDLFIRTLECTPNLR